MIPRKLNYALAAAALLLSAGSRLPAQSTSPYSLLEYPDHEGSIVWTGVGSNGGNFTIRYDFKGFYLEAATPLTSAVALMPGATIPPGLKDVYTLLPMRTVVTGTWNLSETSSFEGRNRTDCWVEQHSGSDRKVITLPGRDTIEGIRHQGAPAPAGFTVPVSMHVWDTRPVKGDARLTLQVTSGALGGSNPALTGRTLFTDYDSPGNVDRTDQGPLHFNYMFDAPGSSLDKVELNAGFVPPGGFLNLWWDAGVEPLVLGGFSPENMGFSGKLTEVVPPSPVRRPCSYVTADDGPWTFTLTYQVHLRKKIDVTLTPADSAEGTWAPEPGQARDYVIKIRDPKPEEISRLRVSLVDTSSHHGVATNLRNHGLPYGACPDCIAGMHTVAHEASEMFGGRPISRSYQQVDICPIDSLPDLFFRDEDNPGFTVEDAVGDGLKYKLGQSIVLDRPAGTDYIVRVAVRDSAARAKLRAEVEIGGVWMPARAEGDTSDSDGESLMLPLDGNANGIHDWWENRFGVRNLRDDEDATPNAAHRGDGLTAFEEYRGVYEEQKLVRTDPTRKNLFVYDASMGYHDILLQARALYRPLGLDVMTLGENEFWSDVVNYNSTAAKAGDQYLIAVMQNPIRPADVGSREFAEQWLTFFGAAAYVGPPVADHHTLMLQYRFRERAAGREAWVLAHELGHLMNLPHHGDGDYILDVPASNSLGLAAGPHLVATGGGEHSGAAECFMRYRHASLFSVLGRPRAYLDALFRQLPPETVPASTLCTSPAGSGLNAAGAWAGDATRGSCLSQLKMRSW